MKFVVIGGGPAGLYFALLAKKRMPQVDIDVYEQNPCDATYGFGIVLADRGLNRLQAADAASCEAITNASFVSRHRVFSHPDETFFIEGGGYGGAIARLRLLQILQICCERANVRVLHKTRIDDMTAFADVDLLVGADGVNSVVRRDHESEFGTTQWNLTNRLAWYGTTKHFPYPILSFKRTQWGHFVAAGYAYTERMSTFVPECDAGTWVRAGLEDMSEEERRRFAETVFADELQGQPLIDNNSIWRTLPVIRNANWSVGNRVLIGDALHSAHPTIGSGTRIAMEDSIALADAIASHGGDIAGALAAFRRVREPQKQKLVDAAEKSFMWYERFGDKVEALAPVDFVFDFLTRTGRVDQARLQAEYPYFMKRYAHRWSEGEHAQSSGRP